MSLSVSQHGGPSGVMLPRSFQSKRGVTTNKDSSSGDATFSKDLSNRTETTAVMDASMDNSRRNTNNVPARGLNRLWGSLRSLNNNNGNEQKERNLPKRQSTFNTAQSSASGSASPVKIEFFDQEERVELLEKIEVLERKLETKEAVLQSMLVEKASRASSPVVNSGGPLGNSSAQEHLAAKDLEIARLDAIVREQAIQMEQMEQDQSAEVERQAELIFQEFMQQENSDTLWEQLQEQKETIQRLKNAQEFQQQRHAQQEREMAHQLRKLREEKQQWLDDSGGLHASFACDNAELLALKAENAKLKAAQKETMESMQAENALLQQALDESQQQVQDYQEQADNLRGMVDRMEQDKENELHLLDIVMSELNTAWQQQEEQEP